MENTTEQIKLEPGIAFLQEKSKINGEISRENVCCYELIKNSLGVMLENTLHQKCSVEE